MGNSVPVFFYEDAIQWTFGIGVNYGGIDNGQTSFVPLDFNFHHTSAFNKIILDSIVAYDTRDYRNRRGKMPQRKSRLEVRAELLAEEYGLSYQLTLVWCKQDPYRCMGPLFPKEKDELIKWARV
jgi:hypothetical protein